MVNYLLSRGDAVSRPIRNHVMMNIFSAIKGKRKKIRKFHKYNKIFTRHSPLDHVLIAPNLAPLLRENSFITNPLMVRYYLHTSSVVTRHGGGGSGERRELITSSRET